MKANGELPCWDDLGEQVILGKVTAEALSDPGKSTVFHSAELLRIRQSFLDDGEYPHPACRLCAVRNQGGPHQGLRPNVLQILHLEASYLCHLSCPECIPASARRGLKNPPYHLSPELVSLLLKQLKKEGVESIKVVHLEGRGDPLMNPKLDQLVRLVKEEYPNTFAMVTTHGSYPYKPWLVECGLDLLRVSIDGAFPESYEKYRVGGDFRTAIDFLRRIRDAKKRGGKPLHVEWKYLLFEWNDTDEEIRHAAKLADELDVQLRFCLTHSPNRSKRFPDIHCLKHGLADLAPKADVDHTFQLRDADESIDGSWVVSDSAAKLLSSAEEALRNGDHTLAAIKLERALLYDPGLKFAEIYHQLGYRRHGRQLIRKAIGPLRLYRHEMAVLQKKLARFSHQVFLWLRLHVRFRTRVRGLFVQLRSGVTFHKP